MTKPDDAPQKLQTEREICSLYIDSAKTFIQLSTGALLLSLAFAHDFLGKPKKELLSDAPLLATWLFWFVSVLSGITYQYCAIKYMETIANENNLLYHPRTWRSLMPKALIENPFWLYGVMMLTFYLGILCFGYVAVARGLFT